MKQLTIIAILTILISHSAMADHGPRLQFIHNSADETLSEVDLWVAYPFSEPQKYVENWNYKVRRLIIISLS